MWGKDFERIDRKMQQMYINNHYLEKFLLRDQDDVAADTCSLSLVGFHGYFIECFTFQKYTVSC